MDHWLQKWVMLGKDLCLKERWGMGEGGGSQRWELAVWGVGGGGVGVCVCGRMCVYVCEASFCPLSGQSSLLCVAHPKLPLSL